MLATLLTTALSSNDPGPLSRFLPGGTLDQYVPFYFGPRSPMMLTYKNGNVTGKREDISEPVYFVFVC
jgi:hypothetical protein